MSDPAATVVEVEQDMPTFPFQLNSLEVGFICGSLSLHGADDQFARNLAIRLFGAARAAFRDMPNG